MTANVAILTKLEKRIRRRTAWLQKCPQRRDELKTFARLIAQYDVRSYLEIGLRAGRTFKYIGQKLPPDARMVGIEYQAGIERWGVAPDQADAAKALIAEAVASCQPRQVNVIWGDSTAPETVEQARALGPYDLVFVDGNHEWDGVHADWVNYGPMARIVAFHDIDAPNGAMTPAQIAQYGVPKLWRRLKRKYRHIEIIGGERGMGIGVLFIERPIS